LDLAFVKEVEMQYRDNVVDNSSMDEGGHIAHPCNYYGILVQDLELLPKRFDILTCTPCRQRMDESIQDWFSSYVLTLAVYAGNFVPIFKKVSTFWNPKPEKVCVRQILND
jgi:hypothetical protein